MGDNSNGIEYKSLLRVLMIVSNCSLGAISFGLMMGMMNPLEQNLRQVLDIPSDSSASAIALLTSMFPLGSMFGAFFSIFFPVVFSKRKLMMLTDLLIIIVVSVSLYPNLESIIMCRLIGGILIGINICNIPVYVQQMSPVSISGAMGSMF